MRIERIGGFCLALLLGSAAGAQETNLTRAEVAAIKARLVAVQEAMGEDPAGYLKDSEEFDLPTDFNPAQPGTYWPITSGITLNYTDRAVEESAANAEQATADFEARYAAAVASGDPNAIVRLTEEMMRLSQLAAAAGLSSQAKQDMYVYVQFNMNPTAGIDPDAVVFESPGVIALRDLNVSDDEGRVTVYLDPVGLAETETLSQIELTTPDGGVSDKTGVYNVLITLNGAAADIEAWAQSFDTEAILAVINRP